MHGVNRQHAGERVSTEYPRKLFASKDFHDFQLFYLYFWH